mmetsp:Transcript_10712/g.17525  ORF Transcript_10712/g.17525 Transcript_10712/m.17525 type:complete len:973 (+) Transcript_10712:229-3147(+)
MSSDCCQCQAESNYPSPFSKGALDAAVKHITSAKCSGVKYPVLENEVKFLELMIRTSEHFSISDDGRVTFSNKGEQFGDLIDEHGNKGKDFHQVLPMLNEAFSHYAKCMERLGAVNGKLVEESFEHFLADMVVTFGRNCAPVGEYTGEEGGEKGTDELDTQEHDWEFCEEDDDSYSSLSEDIEKEPEYLVLVQNLGGCPCPNDKGEYSLDFAVAFDETPEDSISETVIDCTGYPWRAGIIRASEPYIEVYNPLQASAQVLDFGWQRDAGVLITAFRKSQPTSTIILHDGRDNPTSFRAISGERALHAKIDLEPILSLLAASRKEGDEVLVRFQLYIAKRSYEIPEKYIPMFLGEACREASKEKIVACLVRGAVLGVKNLENSQYGRRAPLHHVCMSTSACEDIIDCLILLLNRGADINMPSQENETPLFIATRLGLTKVVEFLLNAGADPCIGPPALDDERCCLGVAAENGDFVILKALLKHGAPVDGLGALCCVPLEEALDSGEWSCMRELLAEYASPTPKAPRTEPYIIDAARHAPADIIFTLAAYGADPSATDVAKKNSVLSILIERRQKYTWASFLQREFGAKIRKEILGPKRTRRIKMVLNLEKKSFLEDPVKYLIGGGLTFVAKDELYGKFSETVQRYQEKLNANSTQKDSGTTMASEPTNKKDDEEREAKRKEKAKKKKKKRAKKKRAKKSTGEGGENEDEDISQIDNEKECQEAVDDGHAENNIVQGDVTNAERLELVSAEATEEEEDVPGNEENEKLVEDTFQVDVDEKVLEQQLLPEEFRSEILNEHATLGIFQNLAPVCTKIVDDPTMILSSPPGFPARDPSMDAGQHELESVPTSAFLPNLWEDDDFVKHRQPQYVHVDSSMGMVPPVAVASESFNPLVFLPNPAPVSPWGSPSPVLGGMWMETPPAAMAPSSPRAGISPPPGLSGSKSHECLNVEEWKRFQETRNRPTSGKVPRRPPGL